MIRAGKYIAFPLVILLLLIYPTACQQNNASPATPQPPATTAAIEANPSNTPTPTPTTTKADPSTATPTPTSTMTPTETPAPTATATAVIAPTQPVLSATLPAPTLFDITWAERGDFAQGLIDSEQNAAQLLPNASIYHINLQISDNLTTLTGSQEVYYTNNEAVSLSEIYFRLFPNLAAGQTIIETVTVNNRPVTPTFTLQNSAMSVPMAPPLAAGEQAVIAMDFSVTVPTADGGNYGTFILSSEVLALAHFYPMIAVYDDQGWNVEIAPPMGDVVYADSSFYRVQVTAPATLTLVASGVEVDRTQRDTLQTVNFVAGPVRDFYLAASPTYTVTRGMVGETVVNSYAPTSLAAGGEDALNFAVKALESFNARFGPYPFTEFDLISTATFALGVEYPGIVAVLMDLYEQPEGGRPAGDLMEGVVAHEVGHQWFYSVVGNDQIDEPWIDEALAQYATLLYYADVYGPQGYDGFRRSLERRWERVDGEEIPIGGPVQDYTPQEYSAIVYGRGPLFIETLAQEMGEDQFTAFLMNYYRTHQWGIAETESFKQVAEQHCDCDLTPLFETWVYPSNN